MSEDYALGTTIYFQFTSRRFSTGVPYALAGTPAVSVREEGNQTPITAGITLSTSIMTSPVTGLNEVEIVATSGNGYESGKSYAAYISAGTVDSVSVVGEVIGRFTIEKQSALRPATAGRTLIVSAGGTANADVKAADGDTGAATKLKRVLLGNVTGTVGTGSTTSSIVTSTLSPAAAVTDQLKGRIITFDDATTTANLRGQSSDITASTSGGVLTVTALTTAPVNGDTFTIS